MRYYDYDGWAPYVSVAERRRKAERAMQKLRKNGHPVSPVVVTGRTIARTFWGKAWCDNLEHYSDFSNRLPRGRTYVRNGSVVDLQIGPSQVRALVSGSELYEVAVTVSAVPRARWTSICTDCAGAIDSLVELLQGRFSKAVMQRICQPRTGLFPAPADIRFSCSCPDWASMCKHVAAVLYGVGARLDGQPELLFTLRKVDEKDLIATAGKGLPLAKRGPAEEKLLGGSSLSELFDLDIGSTGEQPAADAARTSTTATKVRPPQPVPVAEGVLPPTKSSGRQSSTTAERTALNAQTKARTPPAKQRARKRQKRDGGRVWKVGS